MTDKSNPNEQTAHPDTSGESAAEQPAAGQPNSEPAAANPSSRGPAAAPAGGPDGSSSVAGTTEGTEASESELLDALREVIDPELMINVVDLGLVYAVNQDGANVYVDMTLTSPACPAGPQIVQQAKMALERVDGVEAAEIKLVMSPPWSPERMTEDARDRLGIF